MPPFSPECVLVGSGQPMQFIYPYYNATIKLTKQLDGSQGKTIFELAHQDPSTVVYWHLNNDYVDETSVVKSIFSFSKYNCMCLPPPRSLISPKNRCTASGC